MENDNITILVTGDFCPHNRIEEMAAHNDYAAVFNNFIGILKDNDLNITDLECPLTYVKNGRKKTGPHQKASPACIELLKFAGFHLVALANNHIMDYGSAGAQETVDLCQKNGIRTVGVGENEEQASKPFILNIKNRHVAVINVADNEFLTATDGPYQANAIDAVKTCQHIRKIRSDCDFILMIVHAGNEFYHLPSPRTKELYRFFIDAGADAVIANHTHCFSGYEVYRDKPVFYGLGNFIYDWPGRVKTDWNYGYAVKLTVGQKIDFEIIPITQCNEKPGVFVLENHERSLFNETLALRSRIIADDSLLAESFAAYVQSVEPMYDSFIEPYFGKIYNALRRKHMIPNLLNRKKRLLLLNLTRCEAHREVLLNILSKNQ